VPRLRATSATFQADLAPTAPHARERAADAVIADPAVDHPSAVVEGRKTASQAEYAGSIPVIGSTKILFSAIIARTNAFQESVLTGV
jgi:hypothetical protein